MLSVLLLLLSGCETGGEGTEPGECTDRADNDGDGSFDCDDDGCARGPDCSGEGDADTDTDADSDSDTDADADSDTDSDTDADPEWVVCNSGGAPYSDIQDAVDAGVSPITVCAGTYGPVYVYSGDVEIHGEDVATTTIFGGAVPAVRVVDVGLTLSGFTLRGVGDTRQGGALDAQHATLAMSDLSIREASSPILLRMEGGSGTFERVDIIDSSSDTSGSSSYLVAFLEVDQVEFRHALIMGNDARAGIVMTGDSVTVENTIWANNEVGYEGMLLASANMGGGHRFINNVLYNTVTVGDPDRSPLLSPCTTEFRNNIVMGSNANKVLERNCASTTAYNLFWDNLGGNSPSGAGTGNIAADPAFTDAAGGDFSLKSGYSPAINAGDPDARYDDVDGSRNDVGAFGGPGGSW